MKGLKFRLNTANAKEIAPSNTYPWTEFEVVERALTKDDEGNTVCQWFCIAKHEDTTIKFVPFDENEILDLIDKEIFEIIP